MSVSTPQVAIPNPMNTKSVLLTDRQGGAEHNMPATINYNNFVDVPQLRTSVIPTLAESLLSTNALVNLNQAGETQLFTVPAGYSCVITRVVLRNASTSLTTASLAFGFNAGTDTDVIATATHTELTGATLYTILIPKTGAKIGVVAGVFSVITTILQGGAATCTIDVFGYLF